MACEKRKELVGAAIRALVRPFAFVSLLLLSPGSVMEEVRLALGGRESAGSKNRENKSGQPDHDSRNRPKEQTKEIIEGITPSR